MRSQLCVHEELLADGAHHADHVIPRLHSWHVLLNEEGNPVRLVLLAVGEGRGGDKGVARGRGLHGRRTLRRVDRVQGRRLFRSVGRVK